MRIAVWRNTRPIRRSLEYWKMPLRYVRTHAAEERVEDYVFLGGELFHLAGWRVVRAGDWVWLWHG